MTSDVQSKVQARHVKRNAYLYSVNPRRVRYLRISRVPNVNMIFGSVPLRSAGRSSK